MHLPSVSFIMFFALPVIVTACEGECIVGITNAFLSNYTHPIATVLRSMNDDLMEDIHPHTSTPKFLMGPIVSAYQKSAYSNLEFAIFPSCFHGRCQQTDPANPDGPRVNPAGCPNPDCPVICGTPGSLVHFYPKLRYIAYNETRYHLQALATPGNAAYDEVERNFIREATNGDASKYRQNSARFLGGTMLPRAQKHEQAIKDKVRAVMQQLSSRMEKICGGTGTGTLNGLQKCSWETRMKEFILSYP